MKIDEILAEWYDDSRIELDQLTLESLNIPTLHGKYYNFLAQEKVLYREQTARRDFFIKLKWDYYQGNLDDETLKEYKWDQWSMRILKGDMDRYLAADEDLITINLKLGVIKDRIDLLTSIITNINTRNWSIKNIIDWEKFKHGA